jgi:hypothetical protein
LKGKKLDELQSLPTDGRLTEKNFNEKHENQYKKNQSKSNVVVEHGQFAIKI